MNYKDLHTLGDLKKSGYQSKSIKAELRTNLIVQLKANNKIFDSILGFDNTVLPDIERAILSKHNILLLGLRGQAKTRIARSMVDLLDEYIPIVEGSEINDDPLLPLSRYALDKIKEYGDNTRISWIHRNTRYVEKLATPDVSIADLIGDVDPIVAATLKLPYSDERVIHFGLVPRAHRSIFVLNELPDLQARIQVSLFNILQEGDLQIRGFKLRFPLDIQFVFTANPEDYTNRGSIVTPLKDRIESQILTHYPPDIQTARLITSQESDISEEQEKKIHIPDEARDILEMLSFKARDSEFIDEKSGVSARMSISALENLVSAAERRALINNDKTTSVRITDFNGIIPSLTGKVELVYEGEQEGPYAVAIHLLNETLKDSFSQIFPNPDKKLKAGSKDPYLGVKSWFSEGNQLDLLNDEGDKSFRDKLSQVTGLEKLVSEFVSDKKNRIFYMELVLHGLAAFEVLGKNLLDTQFRFSDPLANMFDDLEEDFDLN